MENLCRICRNNLKIHSQSISSVEDGIEIHEMISVIFSIDFHLNDQINQSKPKKICDECYEIIVNAYKLRQIYIESDEFFNSLLCDNKNPVKSENNHVENIKEEIEDFEVEENSANSLEILQNYDSDCEPLRKKAKRVNLTFNPRLIAGKAGKSSFYYCNFCEIQIKSKASMLRHLKLEHDPLTLPYGCSHCPARFKNERSKLSHENVKHRSEKSIIFECEICSVNGVSENGINWHKIHDHNENNFASKREIIHHENRKISMLVPQAEVEVKRTIFNPRSINTAESYNDIFYACNFCDIKLKPRRNLIRHMMNKHDPCLLPFFCNFCSLRFTDEAKKLSHELLHSQNEPRIYHCDVCDATGDYELGMQHHKSDDHGIDIMKATKCKVFDVNELVKNRKKREVIFHPRPLPGSEKSRYEEVWYACNFCDKQIKPKKSMLRHMKFHNPINYPFACEFCVVRFKNRENYENHKHDSDVVRIYFCDICGVSGDNKIGMENHMLDDHLMKSPKSSASKPLETFKCSHCQSKFMHKRGLDNHMLSRHVVKLKCDKCSMEIFDKKEMMIHEMMVHEMLFRELQPCDIEVNLKCCKCEDNFNDEEALLDHLNIHVASFASDKTKCTFCPKNLKNFNEFYEHAKHHALPQTHECLTCKKKLPLDDKLINHVKGHKRYDTYKVECIKCSQKFRSTKDLEIHDKIKHQKETLFICPICARSMSSANGLDQHIRYVHNKEQEKKFQCKFCPMKFILKTKLTRHEAIHSTERPHTCEICGNSFKHLEGLNLHKKRHDGSLEKKHACTQCSHKFTTKHRLDQHMMTHTGLKPHECKFCDRAYASKGDLVKHMQKLHVGDAIYQCDKCPKGFRLIVELREHQMEHGSGK